MARLILLFFLTGCLAGRMMTEDSFAQIQPGMSLEQVEVIAGKPWELMPLPQGQMEAIYCERLSLYGDQHEERRYRILLHEGRVLTKRKEIHLQKNNCKSLETSW